MTFGAPRHRGVDGGDACGEVMRGLTALIDARAAEHDLTPFLTFVLKGVESRCRSLFEEIRVNREKALVRNTEIELFGRLKSPRQRVISARHVQLLNAILNDEEIPLDDLAHPTQHLFRLKNPVLALHRDVDDRLVLRVNRD